MIARQFLSWQFGLTFGAALLLAGAFALAARHYNKTGNKTFSAGSFREPIGYLMSAIGVLVPLIVGGIAYLYARDASAAYTMLLSAAAVLFVAFIVASWLTFSLVSRSTEDDKITLHFPKDWPYRAAAGVVYAGLVTGVLYVAWFFLVDFTPGAAPPPPGAALLIERAAPRVGQTREQVQSALGAPLSCRQRAAPWCYRTDRSTLAIEFDAQGTVQRITETKEP